MNLPIKPLGDYMLATPIQYIEYRIGNPHCVFTIETTVDNYEWRLPLEILYLTDRVEDKVKSLIEWEVQKIFFYYVMPQWQF